MKTYVLVFRAFESLTIVDEVMFASINAENCEEKASSVTSFFGRKYPIYYEQDEGYAEVFPSLRRSNTDHFVIMEFEENE